VIHSICIIAVILGSYCCISQNSKITDLSSQLKETLFNCVRDVRRVEAEKDIILDDLDGLNEQHQQLQDAYTAQSKSLHEGQAELQRMREELDCKDDELARLYREQRERRASFNSLRVSYKAYSTYTSVCITKTALSLISLLRSVNGTISMF